MNAIQYPIGQQYSKIRQLSSSSINQVLYWLPLQNQNKMMFKLGNSISSHLSPLAGLSTQNSQKVCIGVSDHEENHKRNKKIQPTNILMLSCP